MSQSKHIGVCKTKCLANNPKKALSKEGALPHEQMKVEVAQIFKKRKTLLILLTRTLKKHEKL